MNGMVAFSVAVLVASVSSIIWGVQYRGDHPGAALAGFWGKADPTYSLAGWAIGLGILAFFIGIAFLIAGLVRAHRSARLDAPSDRP
jgi:hypothetical protein